MEGFGHATDTEARLREVERRILDGMGLPKLRQWVSETYGLRERQAREIVRTAALRIAADWDIQRPELLAHRLTQLEHLAQVAMEKGQLAVALGAWKHADELVALGAKHVPTQPHHGRP